MNNMQSLITNLGNLEIFWQKHALQRMFERSISRAEVKFALKNGKIIEEYHEDYPYPSVLVAYVEAVKPLHVVFSYDKESGKLYIITAYIPDTKHFEDDLITRKKNEK
ncbi:MAG: DUF4258 domain-containing protein [Sulfurimonas sp.]|jgi:hypothetical protein